MASADLQQPVGFRETKIEDFEMLKTIGTGTFARVFLCKQKSKRGDKNNNNNNNNNYFALKVLSMHDVIRLKQVEHVKNEKNILLEIAHPFLVDMTWHYKV